MNKAQDVMMLSIKVTSDVRRQLEEWAADNVSSMTAEVNRSVKERMARERRQDKVDA